MGVFAKILSAPFGELIGRVGEVIDQIHTSGEEKLQAEFAKLQLQAAVREAERKAELEADKAYMADLANLREQIKVELQSEDAYVRRARPTFLYIFYLIIVCNYLVPIFAQLFPREWVISPVVIPQELWWVFGGGYLGYSFLRSRYDKQANGVGDGTAK